MKYIYLLLSLIILQILSLGQLKSQCDASFGFSQVPNNCAETPVMFISNANPQTVISYSWNFGDGSFPATTQNSSHQYPVTTGNSTYTVTLTVRDTSGASCNNSQNITIQGATPILISVVDSFLCTPDTSVTNYNFTMNVDPSSMGQGPFTVDFGDNSGLVSLPGPVLSHTYTNYGTFDVTVTGNGGGCSGYYKRVFFYTDPIASIQIVDQPFICEGQSITVRNTSDISRGNIDYFLWDWGDFGPSYTTQDTVAQSYQFNLDSIDICVGLPFSGYSDGVTLTAFNQCSDHFTFSQIKIRAKPRADFEWPTPVCLPNAVVNFTNLSCPIVNYSDPATFQWIFEDNQGGSSTSSLPNPTYTYTEPGRYKVTLIAVNNCGADTSEKWVDVIPSPVADFVLDTTFGCINFCVSTTNLSTPRAGVSYFWEVFGDTAHWSFADSSMDSSSFEPIFCFTHPDTFPIRLTASNVCGADSIRDTVYAYRPPTLRMDTIPDTCGISTTLDSIIYEVIDYGLPITAYNWQFTGANITTFSGPNPPPIIFSPGNNNIRLCIENDCGTTCIDRDFLVASLPNIVPVPDASICLNDSIRLTGNPQPGFWTGTDIDSSGLFIPQNGGNYSHIYTYRAANCIAFDTVEIDVRDTPAVNILTPLIQECLDSALLISLDAQPLGGTWIGPRLINGNQFRADTIGSFTFRYEVQDSLATCVGRGFATIEINALPSIDSIPPFVLYCNGNFPEPLPVVQPGGGIWSSPTPIINSAIINNNSINPSIIGPNTVILYYTLTNGSNCSALDSMEVRIVNASPAFAGPGDTLCYNHGIDTLRGMTPAGGRWSAPAGTNYLIDPILGTYNSLDMQVGPNSFTYTVFEGTSCEVSDQTIIEILDTLDLSVGPDLIICSSADTFRLIANVSGGTWSGGVGIDPTTGLFDPGQVMAGSSVTICYEVVNAEGCTSQDCLEILVDSLPIPGFVAPPNACVGDLLTFPITSTYATSHEWDFGDTSGISTVNIHTYSNPNTYTVTQYAFSANGCVDSSMQSITISESPRASFTVDVDSGCADLIVSFTNTSNIAGGVCFWDFGDGDTTTLSNPGSHTYMGDTGIVKYPVILRITNFCDTVSFSDTITVYPKPQSLFGVPLDTGCSVFPVQFANISTGRPTNFEWYLDTIWVDSLFSLQKNPPTQYYPHLPNTGFSSYDIYLIAENQCGRDTSNQEIVVFPNTIDALFNTSDTRGCAPLTVTFTDLSGAPFTSWEINGTNPPGDTVSYTFQNPGTYIVEHRADNDCSFDTNQVVITVLPQPVVGFTADTTTICLGDSVQFTNTSVGISSQIWDFGDTNISSEYEPVHAFNQSGSFTVVLTAFADSNACQNTDSLRIQVLPPPPVGFIPSDTAICPGLPISFSGVPNNLNYLWNFGDSTNSNLQNPTHTYTASGFYQIWLTTTDNLGCSNSFSRSILIHEKPMATFTTDIDSSCRPGNLFTFQNLSPGRDSLSHIWDFGDNSPVSNEENPSHSYASTGIYSSSLIEQNTFGCSDTTFMNLVVLPQPIAAIEALPVRGCSPLVVNFNNRSQNYSSSYWNFGDGKDTTAQDVVHTYLLADTVLISILIVDTANFCFDTAQVNIETRSAPIANFEASQYEACGSARIDFSNLSFSASPGMSFQWIFGNGDSSNRENPFTIFTEAGTYEVMLIARNAFSCTDTVIKNITIYPQATALFNAAPLDACTKQKVTFENLSADATQWRWDFGDSEQSVEENPTHVYESEGIYTVQLIASFDGRCQDTFRIENYIRVETSPEAAFTVRDTSFAPGLIDGFFRFDNTSLGAISYRWDFGDGNGSDAVNPLHQYTTNDTFQVSLIAYADNGCTDTAYQDVFLRSLRGLEVPNAFAPLTGTPPQPGNPDIGDLYTVFFPRGIGLKSYHIAVYTNWGELVWESRALDEGVPSEWWNGKDEMGTGKLMSSGVFIWQVHEAIFDDGFDYTGKRTGNVTLIR